MMPPHDALKPLAAPGADDVDTLAVREDRSEHVLTDLRRLGAVNHPDLAPHTRRGHVRLLEMPGRRLIGLGRRLLDEAELHRFVAVALRGLRLHDNARPRLDDRR